jgi:hypothetical protein
VLLVEAFLVFLQDYLNNGHKFRTVPANSIKNLPFEPSEELLESQSLSLPNL